jgi:hypothetical protein
MKDFVLGIGAQKAGTTWLYTYLRNNPDVGMAKLKEFHTFDAYYLPELCGSFHRNKLAKLKARNLKVEASNKRQPRRPTVLSTLVGMHYNLQLYVHYFEEMARRDVKLVGEITPSYSMLNAEHFRGIRDLLSSKFRLKFVFLMRDPIERCYSALRMMDQRAHVRGRDPATNAELKFRDEIVTDACRLRTQYERTMTELEQVFDRKQIFYGIYESFFREEKVAELCEFLEIRYTPPKVDERSNASPTRGALSQGDIDFARRLYAPTCDFCAARFGRDVIKKNWKWYDHRGAPQEVSHRSVQPLAQAQQ